MVNTGSIAVFWRIKVKMLIFDEYFWKYKKVYLTLQRKRKSIPGLLSLTWNQSFPMAVRCKESLQQE